MANQRVKRRSIVGLCMIILSLLFAFPVSAAEKSEKQLTIISLKSDPLVVGREVNVKVHVDNIIQNGSGKTENMDQANVVMSLSNGEDKQHVSFTNKGSGDYETKVKLSKTGTWNVSVVALNRNRQKSDKDIDTMETTWEVKQEEDNTGVWWLIGIVVVIIGIIIFWLIRRKKKKQVQKK